MNYVAEDFVSKSDLRNKMIDRIDVLNKVKELFLIPKIELIPMRQVAEFYETTVYAIRSVYQRHRDEIDSDGVKIMTSKELFSLTQNELDFKKYNRSGYYVPFGNTEIVITGSKLIYFSPRAVLRIGMLLRDSEVAKEVRTQLLNTFECATEEQKTEAIDEEGRLLLDIIRAESDDLVAVGLKKYRDYMNRHIAKLENEKANLQTELDVVHNSIATWKPQEVVKCLVAAIAHTIRGENKFAFAWGRLKKNLYHHHGINLEARRVKSGKNKPYVSFIKNDEWDKVIQECYALAKEAKVNIVEAVGSINAESLKKYDELIATAE